MGGGAKVNLPGTQNWCTCYILKSHKAETTHIHLLELRASVTIRFPCIHTHKPSVTSASVHFGFFHVILQETKTLIVGLASLISP